VIQAGVIKPIGTAAKGKDEEVLESLLEGAKSCESLDSSGLEALKNRGLVSSSKTKEWRYEITPRAEG